MVERSSDLLVAYGSDGRIAYASSAVSRALGWGTDELVGTDGMHLVHPDDRSDLATALVGIAGDDYVPQQVFRVQHRDGGWHYMEARATNHLDDPEVEAILVSLRDVTDRIETEAAARQQDQRYRHLVESTTDAVLIHHDDVVVHANRAAANLFGTSDPDRLAGLPLDALVAEDPGASGEQRLLRLDGRSLDAEITSIPTVWDGLPATQMLARDITDRREKDLHLLHQATHDPLTGLPNRSLLNDRLEHATARAVRTRRAFAVLFVDLDRFKVVNDTLGHEVGDELLRQIAGRLTEAVRPGDTVARLGGDEFVVIVEDLLVADTVDLVVERIQDGFAQPFSISDRDCLINASIGVLVTAEGDDPRALLRDADAAMYTAKTQGRGRAVRFDASLRERESRYQEVRLRLRAAIEEGELLVEYQLVMRLSDRRVLGAEALLRWEHPERGRLLPETFLDVADDAGLLPELGARVLEATCAQLARWRNGRSSPDSARQLWASINVSGNELMQPGFGDLIAVALSRHDLPGVALCLEVTEEALLADPARAAEVLRPVRDLGVGLAIDDFGTGFTSLAVLRRFSPEYLKIDRSFVSGMADSPSDAALVRAVIQMGHALGISVVAKGVELVEQQHLLGVLGCDLAQGFLLGGPRPGDQLVVPGA